MTKFNEALYTRQRQTSGNANLGSTNLHQVNYAGTKTPYDPWKVLSTTDTPNTCEDMYSGEMWDVVTPGFLRKMRSGMIINHHMEKHDTWYTRGIMTVNRGCVDRSSTTPYTYSGYIQTGTSVIGDPSSWYYPLAPSVDENVIAQAITDAWASISLNESDILVQIAESKKTVYSLISILRHVMKIVRNVEQLKLRALMKEISPKELANRWMECRYALRPLMYDARGIITAYYSDYKRQKMRQTFRAYASDVANTSETDVLLWSSSAGTLRGNATASRTIEVRAGVLTFVESLQTLGLWGFTEPFEAAWELIPYSFIIDWFFNVGKLLASWTPNIGFKTLASWYVVTDYTYLMCQLTSGTNIPTRNYWDYRYVSGSYSKTDVFKYRCPNPDRPGLPSIQFHLSKPKLLDLGIILKNLYGSMK